MPSNLQTVVFPKDSQLLITGVIIAFALTFIHYVRSPYRKLPPGPPGVPILGNALSLRSALWVVFTQWQKTYGDIISISAFGQRIVVLNTREAAVDLLDRRAGIYSDRPRNIVAGKVLCGGMGLGFQQHGPLWRRMRKAAHGAMNKNVAEHFRDTQLLEALVLASDTMKQPSEWQKHLRRAAASMIMSVLYDMPMIESEQDPRIKDINDFAARLTRAALPGSYLVEFLPWMMRIPSRFAKWKREAEDWHAKDSVVFEDLFTSVQEKIIKGTGRPSISGTLIGDSSRYGLTTRENAWLAGFMYAAGAETTSTSMAWWTLAMLVYPETQKRAQEELDAVVGRTRIPTFADLPHLPYIRAMVKETLRWAPVGPVGLPHCSTEDDYYEGYFIPKGTIVMANVWLLNRDPGVYGEDAAHFNPARHLDANGQLAPGPEDTKEEGHVTYG
ncbi:cytochrome P450, partial [Amylostereum chailletii]